MTAIAVAVLFLILGLRSVSFDSKQTAYNDGVLGAIYRDLGQYQDALKWLRAGAEKGNANAQNNLGIMYHDGQGVPQDYTQAMQWIHKAAEQDNVKAEFNLGLMYHEGQGTLQDYTQAKQWFSKAAEQGDINAQYSLGIMDKEGQGKQFPQ
jgi:TPR repeat protein